MVFNFWTLLLKLYIFWGCDIFSCLVVMQSTQFFSGSTYKICVSYEAFFFITMRMPWSLNFSGWWHPASSFHPYIYAWHLNGVVLSCQVTNKIHMSYLKHIPAEHVSIPYYARCYLRIRGFQTWSFDQVTKMRSHVCLKNLYLYLLLVYS